MDSSKDLAIVILVGGKSRRFGTEKSVMDVFGKPLILHEIDTLSSFDEDIFLVARSQDQIQYYNREIDFSRDIKFILDDTEFVQYENFVTPLLGIYSAFKELANLNFKKAFLLSGDSPLIKPEVIELIIKESDGYDCCIPKWDNGFLEHLFAIYSVEKTFKRAKELMSSRMYALDKLLDPNWKINYISVKESIKPLDNELVSLININGPIDIEKLIKYYKKKA